MSPPTELGLHRCQGIAAIEVPPIANTNCTERIVTSRVKRLFFDRFSRQISGRHSQFSGRNTRGSYSEIASALQQRGTAEKLARCSANQPTACREGAPSSQLHRVR